MRIKCVLVYVDVIRKLLQMWRHISVFLWSWIFIYHSSKHRFLCHAFHFLSVSTICTIVSPHTTIFVNSSYIVSSKVHPLTRKQIPVKSLIKKNRAGVTKNYLCENYCNKLYDLMHIVYYLKILYFPAVDFAWRHISGITEENNQKKNRIDCQLFITYSLNFVYCSNGTRPVVIKHLSRNNWLGISSFTFNYVINIFTKKWHQIL